MSDFKSLKCSDGDENKNVKKLIRSVNSHGNDSAKTRLILEQPLTPVLRKTSYKRPLRLT